MRDALGNVLEKQDSDLGPCAQSCVRWDSGQTVTYAYGGPYDQLTSSSGKIAETFTYNGIGSMTGRSGSTYAVDLEQRLTGVTTSGGTWTYYKDGLGRTEEEVGPSYSVWYAYLGDGRLAYQDNQTSGVKSSFVYLGSQILFRKDSSSASAHFYATDLSNNVRLVWSYASGVVVEGKVRYKPFGEIALPGSDLDSVVPDGPLLRRTKSAALPLRAACSINRIVLSIGRSPKDMRMFHPRGRPAVLACVLRGIAGSLEEKKSFKTGHSLPPPQKGERPFMVMPLNVLEKSINKRVQLLLKDNRLLEGKLVGYDDYMNMVLEDTEETKEDNVRRVGTVVLRGNNVVTIVPK